MDFHILEEIGFTKREVQVYVTLLELNESSIGNIAKKSRVTPAKTYLILEKLKEKGLITSVIKNNIQWFQALNPDRILYYLKEQKRIINEKESIVKNILPQLQKKQELVAQHSATIYESAQGWRALYDEILDYLVKQKEDFIGFTLGNEFDAPDANLFFKQYDARREEQGITVRLVGLEKQRKFLVDQYTKRKNVKLRYTDLPLPTGIIIFADKVAQLVWGDVPVAFVMQSKSVADDYRKFFEYVWKIAKP